MRSSWICNHCLCIILLFFNCLSQLHFPLCFAVLPTSLSFKRCFILRNLFDEMLSSFIIIDHSWVILECTIRIWCRTKTAFSHFMNHSFKETGTPNPTKRSRGGIEGIAREWFGAERNNQFRRRRLSIGKRGLSRIYVWNSFASICKNFSTHKIAI